MIQAWKAKQRDRMSGGEWRECKFSSSIVHNVTLKFGFQAISLAHEDIIAYEFAQEHADWLETYREHYRPRTAGIVEYGQTISEERRNMGRENCLRLRETIHQTMIDNRIDLWICPSAPDVAPEGIHSTGNSMMNLLWTHSGLPCVTVPAGKGDKDLPLGLQVCAHFGDDEALLAWAQQIASIVSS